MKEHIILTDDKIRRMTERMAHQIMEDVYKEPEAVLAGIYPNGPLLAERLKLLIEARIKTRIRLAEIHLNKQNPLASPPELKGLPHADWENKPVILVDDVMNSGKTTAFALSELLKRNVSKIKTAVLVERNHKDFPIQADFVGYALSTHLHDHIEVVLGEEDKAVLR
jgi:pyrimidine operon attenuation protein/uracil phosphoribosyltransferase